MSLPYRIQNNQLRDLQTSALIKVQKLEPLPLRKVWLNDLAQTVAELAAHTERLLDNAERNNAETASNNGCRMVISRDNPDHDLLPEGFSSKKSFCKDLVKHGLLDLLSSGEPEHLGFGFDLYRHRR